MTRTSPLIGSRVHTCEEERSVNAGARSEQASCKISPNRQRMRDNVAHDKLGRGARSNRESRESRCEILVSVEAMGTRTRR